MAGPSHKEEQLQFLKGRFAEMGGAAFSPEDGEAYMAHWTEFAGSEEGAAFLAELGLTEEEFLAENEAGIDKAVKNWRREHALWRRIQGLQADLGMDVEDFVPPGQYSYH